MPFRGQYDKWTCDNDSVHAGRHCQDKVQYILSQINKLVVVLNISVSDRIQTMKTIDGVPEYSGSMVSI